MVTCDSDDGDEGGVVISQKGLLMKKRIDNDDNGKAGG